jgi:hypothetical protein
MRGRNCGKIEFSEVFVVGAYFVVVTGMVGWEGKVLVILDLIPSFFSLDPFQYPGPS